MSQSKSDCSFSVYFNFFTRFKFIFLPNCFFYKVHISNDGKCGVCGDAYTALVKENEAGGKYALGIITRYVQIKLRVTFLLIKQIGYILYKNIEAQLSIIRFEQHEINLIKAMKHI